MSPGIIQAGSLKGCANFCPTNSRALCFSLVSSLSVAQLAPARPVSVAVYLACK